MAEKKEAIIIPDAVTKALEQTAKLMGVAVGELWSIFVQHYFVRGITEAFTGLVFIGLTVFLYQFVGLWALFGVGISLLFFYGAIQSLGNPKYYALEDILDRVKNFRKDEK